MSGQDPFGLASERSESIDFFLLLIADTRKTGFDCTA